MNTRHTTSRRKFFKQANCAAVGSVALSSSLFTLKMTAAAASGSTPSGYKALICLFLNGGNDSFNMLAPKNASAYADYSAIRGDLALDNATELLPITASTGVDGQAYSEFGVHHKLPYLQALYNTGNLAFVANVGTLIQPMTLAQYTEKTVPKPIGLFSHPDHQIHWQTVVPQVRGSGPKGWAGRMADCMSNANLNGSVGMNISLAGKNVLQVGNATIPYITSPTSGAVQLIDYNDATISNAVSSILGENYGNIYQKTLASSNKSAIDTAVAFDAAVSPKTTTEAFENGRDSNTNAYNGSQTSLDKQLQMVAKILSAREPDAPDPGLNMDRQVFFVERGGWDHHNEVISSQENLFTEINDAIEDFWTELGVLGLQDDVVLYTASDFGRTLTSNGKGSDHAWGGNAFILGGAALAANGGGDVHGIYPDDLSTGNPLDLGRGRLLPTTSVDQYCAEMASWFGVPASELSTVFPNCTNFYDPVATPYPLGILGS